VARSADTAIQHGIAIGAAARWRMQRKPKEQTGPIDFAVVEAATWCPGVRFNDAATAWLYHHMRRLGFTASSSGLTFRRS
jgi:hypothetical protein